MGFLKKLWTIHVEMGVSESVGSDVPNLMKDVPNFVKDVPNVPKCVQTLPYGFQNEIMDHPCSNGGPESDMIGCTKFNEKCTKFCHECTEGPKMRFDVRIDSQSFCYGFLQEIMDHPC